MNVTGVHVYYYQWGDCAVIKNGPLLNQKFLLGKAMVLNNQW